MNEGAAQMTRRDQPKLGEKAGTAGLSGGERRGTHLKEKAAEGTRQFVTMFLYLFFVLGLLRVHEAIILREHNIEFTGYGFALVNALVLAKVMLVAEDLHVGRRFEVRPLIYPVLLKSLMFMILLLGFHVIEEVIGGLWHGKSFLESIPKFGGGGLPGAALTAVIATVALIPYFAYTEMSRVLGSATLHTLLWRRGRMPSATEFKLPPGGAN
jgi:hypothetical protein